MLAVFTFLASGAIADPTAAPTSLAHHQTSLSGSCLSWRWRGGCPCWLGVEVQEPLVDVGLARVQNALGKFKLVLSIWPHLHSLGCVTHLLV